MSQFDAKAKLIMVTIMTTIIIIKYNDYYNYNEN